jgi:hypothetical protein
MGEETMTDLFAAYVGMFILMLLVTALVWR